MRDRATIDVDAEVRADVQELFQFLKAKKIPSDLSENISGWSVVSMPPGYRDRSITIHQNPHLRVAVLCPLDFVISKLRRFTEEDIHDALFIVKKFSILAKEIERAAEEAIGHSVKDTALFLFQNNVGLFLNKIKQN
jgi:small basic protein